MLKIKLLISWFKKILVILCVILITACSSNFLFNSNIKSLTNLVMVNQIPEEYGMYLTSQLQSYLGNNNIYNAKYLLNSNIVVEENLHLVKKYGFSTQAEIWLTVNWQLIDKTTNKIYVSSSDYHPIYYNIMPSSYATLNNKDLIITLTLKTLAKNIAFKILALLKETNGNLLNNTTTIPKEKILPSYENNYSPN